MLIQKFQMYNVSLINVKGIKNFKIVRDRFVFIYYQNEICIEYFLMKCVYID